MCECEFKEAMDRAYERGFKDALERAKRDLEQAFKFGYKSGFADGGSGSNYDDNVVAMTL